MWKKYNKISRLFFSGWKQERRCSLCGRAHPIAELKPVAVPGEALRPFGLCAGEFRVPEDFDAPLAEDILNAFEGI